MVWFMLLIWFFCLTIELDVIFPVQSIYFHCTLLFVIFSVQLFHCYPFFAVFLEIKENIHTSLRISKAYFCPYFYNNRYSRRRVANRQYDEWTIRWDNVILKELRRYLLIPELLLCAETCKGKTFRTSYITSTTFQKLYTEKQYSVSNHGTMIE